MTHSVDTLLVFVVLGIAVVYAVSSLGPRSLRRRLLTRMSTGLLRLPQVWGIRQLRARAERAANKDGGACGGCDNCASTIAAAPTGVAPEVRVPITKIGHRAVH